MRSREGATVLQVPHPESLTAIFLNDPLGYTHVGSRQKVWIQTDRLQDNEQECMLPFEEQRPN